MRRIAIATTFTAILALAACTTPQNADVTMARFGDALTGTPLPAIQTFAPARATPTGRSNADIAGKFLDLQFRMESGRALPRLTRFEGPVTVALTGDVPVSAPADLSRLITRLRDEAAIDIRPASGAGPASVTVEFHSRRALQRVVPNAACFVVPNVSSLAEYKAKRGTPAVDWANLHQRSRVAVFAPSDTSPQEVRDCLHEELAQALGPLNDLFSLQDSVFNDDNFNTVLTGFDMLVLRMHYSDDLRSGMNEAEVAARLPALLARLNPAGGPAGIASKGITPRSWTDAVMAATGGRSARAGAERMLAIARAQGWTDSRLAFSHYMMGRAHVGNDLATATRHFSEAGRLWRGMPGGGVHAAHVDMQLAAFALSGQDHGAALAYTERALPIVRAAQNAALLATLLTLRAEAFDAIGDDAAARQARLDSLGWARYGFGSEADVQTRLRGIAALAGRGTRG